MPFFVGYICYKISIQQSMKIKELLEDSMLLVGCVVGVSFVTGKEAQVFVGNCQNIVVFAIAFAFCTFVMRKFCTKWQLNSTQQFVQFAFEKGGNFLHFAMLLCYFVCMVTTLATVQNSLQQLVGNLSFPLWSAVVVIASAWVQKMGTKAFKALSALAFAGAFVTFLLVASNGHSQQTGRTSPLATLLYSLFSATMALPICCKMKGNSTKQNAICVMFATVVVSLLLWWVEKIADFNLQLPIGGKLTGGGKICMCVTVALCGVLGTVANALPICEDIADVIADEKLLRFVVFALAWAFSCFGLDVLLKYGYLFVAVVGLVIVVICLKNKKSPLPR